MGVIIRSMHTIYGLDAALANLATADATEIVNRTDADNLLQANITAEETARIAAVNTLLTNLTAEATLRSDADDALQSHITAEELARTNAINTEISDRTAADSALGARIDSLGSVFSYRGTVQGGVDEANAFDFFTVTGLVANDTYQVGDYFRVTEAGYFNQINSGLGDGVTITKYLNVGDGLVISYFGEGLIADVLDSTDSIVDGTANFITVTGSTTTGFNVDVDTVFKTRVTTLETGLATEITDRTTAVAATDAALAAEVAARLAAEAALETLLKAFATESARLGGSRNNVENIIVASNKITLAFAPKDGAFSIANYMTCRYTDSTTSEAWDYPVVLDSTDSTGKTFVVSTNATGDLDGKTVAIQYTYVNVA